MAESVFGKPIDNAIQEINDKIGTVPSGETVEGQIDALNGNFTPTAVNLIGWGTFGNGVHTINSNPTNGTLVRIYIGYNNNYGMITVWGSIGDTFKIVTEDGVLSIEQTSANSITIYGAGNNSPLRQIKAYPTFVFN